MKSLRNLTVISLILALALILAAGPALAGEAKRFKAGKEAGSIDHKVFMDLVKNKPDSIILVDVRDKEEFEAGTIKGAVNITYEELEEKLPKWNPKKPVIFVCNTGAQSGEAYYMVEEERKDLLKLMYYVDGDLTYDGKGGFKLTPAK